MVNWQNKLKMDKMTRPFKRIREHQLLVWKERKIIYEHELKTVLVNFHLISFSILVRYEYIQLEYYKRTYMQLP